MMILNLKFLLYVMDQFEIRVQKNPQLIVNIFLIVFDIALIHRLLNKFVVNK